MVASVEAPPDVTREQAGLWWLWRASPRASGRERMVIEMTLAREAKLTSKGQITIPLEIRRALGLATGDRVEFSLDRDGLVTVRRRDGSIDAIFGRLKGRQPVLGSDDEAIAAEVLERDDRSRRKRR